MFDVNFWAVLVVAIISTGLGMLWYGPLFGKPWKQMMGFTDEAMQSMKMSAKRSMVLGFITALVTACILAFFVVQVAGMSTFAGGAIIAFWVWLGFFATTQMGDVLWNNKPWKLYLINTSYSFVNLLIAGGILAVWS